MRPLFMVLFILLTLGPVAAQEPLGYAEVQVGSTTIGQETKPDVAADRLGNVGVVWHGQSDLSTVLFLQLYDSAGQPNGAVNVLPDTGTFPSGPQIGFDDTGRLTVIWNDGVTNRINGRRFAADGQPLGSVFTIADFSMRYTAIAVAPDGHFVVAWVNPVTDLLHARRIGADNIPLGDVLTVSPPAAAEFPESLDIAVRRSGDFVVSWTDSSPSMPSLQGVFIRFFNAAGQATSDALELSYIRRSATFLDTSFGGLTAADDEVAIAYEDAEAEAIKVQRFSWSGTPLGAEITVSAAAGSNEHSPTLAKTATGSFLIVWARDRRGFQRPSEPRNRLWGRWLEPDGTPRGAAFWMSPQLASAISATAAAVDGLGNVVVAHHNLPGNVYAPGHIFARRLASDTRTGTVQLHAPANERFEGDTQAPITAVRSGGNEGMVSVRYHLTAGSATPHADYVNQEGTITFEDGETGPKNVAVFLRDDRELERDETLVLTISDATGGAQLATPATATITVIDNDFSTAATQPASSLPPFQLNAASPDVHRVPTTATHASGIHAVAWMERDAFTAVLTVYARRFDRQGRPLGDSIALGEVAHLDELTVRPALSFDASGGLFVVWGVEELQGRYVDAAGALAGEAFQITTDDCSSPGPLCSTWPYDPSVVAVSADTFAVVWNELPTFDPTTSIRFRLVDRHGEERSELSLVGLTALEGRAAAYADGSFIVVWAPEQEAGLHAQRFDAMGSPLGNPIVLTTQAPIDAPRPAVATGPGARAFVVYQDPGEFDGNIYGLLLDGNTVGEPFPVSTALAVQQENPAVAVDSEGNAIVAWGDLGQEGTGPGIYARRISATGQPLGEDVRVMTTRRGAQRNVALTAGPSGNVLAVWEGESPSGESDILGRFLPTGRCGGDALVLCLNNRFLVEVEWEDFEGSQGHGQAVDLTADTGAFYFFDQDNIELAVKVLDGTAANGHHWVFYGALSNVAFDLTVTDLETGAVAQYSNPLGNFASVGDITALPALATPVAARAASIAPKRLANTGGFATFPALPGKGSCAADATTLCLGDGRFQVTTRLTGATPLGGNSTGQARPQTDDTGTFWFFDEDNIELIIKVLDGTAANGHHWVFYGALSNVGYEVTVTDTVTGVTKTYDNPSGTFASVGDTMALPDMGP